MDMTLSAGTEIGSHDGRLVSVPIHVPSQGGPADVGKPVPLFVTHVTHIGGALPSARAAVHGLG